MGGCGGTGGSEAQRGQRQRCAPAWFSPVGLPDVDRLGVIDTMLFCHVVQEVKEESDSNRRRTLCAEDGHKHIVDKLLQRPLEEDGQVDD